jgi:hypothetical protein
VWRIGTREDVAAGLWRTRVFGGDATRWPAAHPQHERRKYLHTSIDGARLERFAGLGRYGRLKLDRARRLADAGFSARPFGVARGFLEEEWLDGRRLRAADAAQPDTIERLAAYLAFVRREFATGRSAPMDDLAEMIDVNTPGMRIDGAAFDEEEVAVDGRMLPHEWIRAGNRLVKADALDHHADDFLPGCRDIAWDVAGAIVEFDMRPATASALVTQYRNQSGDNTIGQRLSFYVPAYLAFRIGYATMAAESLGTTDEGRRFMALAARYRRSLGARAARRAQAR